MQNQSGGAGIPAVSGRMIAQPLYLFPTLAVVSARKQPCRFGSGIECSVGIAQRPDLRELIRERQRSVGSVHHGGKLRIFGRPVVDETLCELGHLPSLTRVFRAPHAGAVPFAAATGPQQTRGRVTDDGRLQGFLCHIDKGAELSKENSG
jgi:hypothetical protein